MKRHRPGSEKAVMGAGETDSELTPPKLGSGLRPAMFVPGCEIHRARFPDLREVKMFDYSEARQRMLDALLRAAEWHDSGCLERIEDSYDSVDTGLPRDSGREFDKLFVALTFWDAWIDARNHDWRYYKGVEREDWPRLARSIVADLQADREITNPVVRQLFDPSNSPKQPSIVRRLLQLLGRKG